jgi:hypothetical protein
VSDEFISDSLHTALRHALAQDGAISVRVQPGGRSPATHEARVSAGDREVIVLALAANGDAVVATGFTRP